MMTGKMPLAVSLGRRECDDEMHLSTVGVMVVDVREQLEDVVEVEAWEQVGIEVVLLQTMTM